MVNVEEFNFALTEGHARMPYRNGIVVDLFDVIPDRTCFKYKGVRFALQDFNIQVRRVFYRLLSVLIRSDALAAAHLPWCTVL